MPPFPPPLRPPPFHRLAFVFTLVFAFAFAFTFSFLVFRDSAIGDALRLYARFWNTILLPPDKNAAAKSFQLVAT